MSKGRDSGSAGLGVGALIAAFTSYTLGNPLGWVCVHAFCSWLYVIYVCMGFGGGVDLDVWGEPAFEQHGDVAPVQEE